MLLRHFWDKFWEKTLAISALVAVLTLGGIFLLLLTNGRKAFSQISLTEFFFGSSLESGGV